MALTCLNASPHMQSLPLLSVPMKKLSSMEIHNPTGVRREVS